MEVTNNLICIIILHFPEPSVASYPTVYNNLSRASSSDGNDTCESSDLSNILTPYLFPLMIEFAVAASFMCLAIWENCGVGLQKPDFVPMAAEGVDEIRPRSASYYVDAGAAKSETGSTVTKLDDVHNDRNAASNYYNSNIGFVIGWLTILASVVSVIVVLYLVYSGDDGDDVIEPLSYSINAVISLLCGIAIPVTMSLMSKLTFKDEEIKELRAKSGKHHGEKMSDRFKGIHKALDKKLMFNTYLSVMVFKVLSMIAAYQMDSPIIFIDGIICIISGFIQTTFINFYAAQKRSTTIEDRNTKPGRQGLEFLRCANFALWLINTFLLKNTEAKKVHYEAFGTTAWAIISNVFQPLAILYYFHSMVCLADIIAHCYSSKYIGLKRPSKKSCRGSKSEMPDLEELPETDEDDEEDNSDVDEPVINTNL